MRLRKLTISAAVAIALLIPASVFAATSDSTAAKTVRHFFGVDTTKLTEQQKADVADYTTKMANLQKEAINKMVTNGSMTKEQGDAAIKKIDDAVANGTFGMGMGKGGPGGKGGKRDGLGADFSQLTDAQKSDFSATYKKIADLQKEHLKKQVASGLITQIQADSAAERIDSSLSRDKAMMGLGKGGFGGNFALQGIDKAKLTDAQKAELEDYSKKLDELQKELINKAVTHGLMTKEQGDSAIQRIENGVKDFAKGGSMKGKRQ